jgi:hypothetical protein
VRDFAAAAHSLGRLISVGVAFLLAPAGQEPARVCQQWW